MAVHSAQFPTRKLFPSSTLENHYANAAYLPSFFPSLYQTPGEYDAGSNVPVNPKAAKKLVRKERAAIRRNEREEYKSQLDRFVSDPKQSQLSFPAFLSKTQRKRLHQQAVKLGLKSKSVGSGENPYNAMPTQAESFLIHSRHSPLP